MSQRSLLLLREPLNVSAAIAAVSGPGVGGVDIFLGVTRSEQRSDFGALTALDYHAYEEMALAEMGRCVAQAEDRWPLLAVALWHRLGVVAVGEVSVVVAVGCAHRGDAFEACRFLIDALKKTVPIWKKELYTGTTHWQGER
jgi:molybdopterin synthase catalytic subunit